VVFLENKKKEIIMMKLSDEALGAVMMALQKSLIEQSDIVPVLKGFDFKTNEKNELFVMNPPTFKMNQEDFETLTDTDA
jgi:hypothetical protein